MITEADTCRKYVLPKLYAAGWSDDQIREQKYFTDGRIVVAGRRHFRKPGKKTDYLLYYSGLVRNTGCLLPDTFSMAALICLKYWYKCQKKTPQSRSLPGIQMPLPSMLKQERLREVKGKVDVFKGLQATTAAELDALLPSILDKAFMGEL